MKIHRTNVSRVLILIGYGMYIGTSLLQSLDVFEKNFLLAEIGKIGLGFGSAIMLIYLLNRNGCICELKKKFMKE